MLKLDIGCGKNKVKAQDEHQFTGVDSIAFDGVDIIMDVRRTPWPWGDNSVDEVFSSHFLEHLTGEERVLFFNELYRVMKPGARALIITPDWTHACAYGDPTHKWPPISSWYALYLNKGWREVNAPHVGYNCDFDWSHSASWDEWLMTRHDDVKAFAMQRYVNSVRDLHIHLVKKQQEKSNV